MIWKNRSNKVLLFLFSFLSCFFKPATPAKAQVIPDNSLGNSNSVVIPNVTVKEDLVELIEGGSIRENNLFHSFQEFNINKGDRVYFANPDNITNIFTRVTGNNISEIFGTLGVNGEANLFLLNPNGIVFGENANLDINASFLATTADSYIFNNNFEYGAIDPQIPPLLTINIPLGLQFGSSSGTIINQSRFATDNENIQGLTIPSQQTLSLIGNDVLQKGGHLSTSQGNIEIISVAPENKVNLIPQNNNWVTDYSQITNFADIKINSNGGIDGGEVGNSNITLVAKNISLGYDLETIKELGYELEDFFTLESLPKLDQLPEDRVEIKAINQNNQNPPQISIIASDTFSLIKHGEIFTTTNGTGNAGKIDILGNSIIMYSSGFGGDTLENSTGNGGVITIDSNKMSVINSGVGVSTLGSGNGGKIKFNIAGDLKIQSGGFGADTFSKGNGGTIEINAQNLEVISAGAGVNSLGEGNAGTIDINITNNLKVQFGGFGSDSVSTGNGGKISIDAKSLELSSAGFGVNARNEGNGGQIKIKAETIILENAGIGSESGQNIDYRDFDSNNLQEKFGQKDAGDSGIVSIEANSLFLDNGGQITTSTFGRGNAGTIDIKVNYLQLDGDNRTNISSSTNGSGDGGNINIIAEEITISDRGNIVANSDGMGNAGNIFIDANNLIALQDMGVISVDGGIEGRSGNINLQADRINLSQNSNISAKVNRGDEGNITLTGNSLFLKDNSQITTNGTGDATGGNMFINLQNNLLAMDNSSIIADAIRGRGGNIEISTKGLFISPNSSISASSKFGQKGNVNINNINGNRQLELSLLPNNFINNKQQIYTSCNSKRSSFSYTGKGSVLDRSLLIGGHNIWEDLRPIPTSNNITTTKNKNFSKSLDKNRDRIIEAQTWNLDELGNLSLVALSSDSGILQNKANC